MMKQVALHHVRRVRGLNARDTVDLAFTRRAYRETRLRK